LREKRTREKKVQHDDQAFHEASDAVLRFLSWSRNGAQEMVQRETARCAVRFPPER
jgi:hypothetical protein